MAWLVLVACVAVTLSVSACTASGAPLSDPIVGNAPKAQEIPQTLDPPEPQIVHDQWTVWTTGQNEIRAKELGAVLFFVSEQMGHEIDFVLPNDLHYSEGWLGISKFRSDCIVGLYEDAQTEVDGSVSVSIFQRYNDSLQVDFPWSANYAALGDGLQHYADWCNGGELPEPYVMDEEDIADEIDEIPVSA